MINRLIHIHTSIFVNEVLFKLASNCFTRRARCSSYLPGFGLTNLAHPILTFTTADSTALKLLHFIRSRNLLAAEFYSQLNFIRG
jgi:hypothetical protein